MTPNPFKEKRMRLDLAETTVFRAQVPQPTARAQPPAAETFDTEDALLMRCVNDDEMGLPADWAAADGGFVLETIYMEITTRSMDVTSRAAFVKAKRAELEEFFSNMVWSVHRGERPDAKRVLNARWLLKWSKNPDGTDRAKARLVLQGYNDPDALAGKLIRPRR